VRFGGLRLPTSLTASERAQSGEPWTEMNIQDLRAYLDFGNTYADAASMLRRDEDEVRQKAKELGLVEHRKNGDKQAPKGKAPPKRGVSGPYNEGR
jgi:hypothetical protein